jgi:hypothetical protein
VDQYVSIRLSGDDDPDLYKISMTGDESVMLFRYLEKLVDAGHVADFKIMELSDYLKTDLRTVFEDLKHRTGEGR